MTSAATHSILQLRIELLDVAPLIWRRIQVPDGYTFWDLHVAIQSAFGWNDSHLHEFEVLPGRNAAASRFGIPMDEDADWISENDHRPPLLPGWKHRLVDYLSLTSPAATYCYDFGDNWRHAVKLEEVLSAATGKKYPRCIAGERAGPPDDCGGTFGYAELLHVLADPSHPEYASSHRWASSNKRIKGKFDPAAFDEQQVKFDNPARRLKLLLEHFDSN